MSRLVYRCGFRGEDGFKSPLLVLVVQQYDRRDVQRFPAISATRQFSLQILQESIREMIECLIVPS